MSVVISVSICKKTTVYNSQCSHHYKSHYTLQVSIQNLQHKYLALFTLTVTNGTTLYINVHVTADLRIYACYAQAAQPISHAH